jgi:hypothetical protein
MEIDDLPILQVNLQVQRRVCAAARAYPRDQWFHWLILYAITVTVYETSRLASPLVGNTN